MTTCPTGLSGLAVALIIGGAACQLVGLIFVARQVRAIRNLFPGLPPGLLARLLNWFRGRWQWIVGKFRKPRIVQLDAKTEIGFSATAEATVTHVYPPDDPDDPMESLRKQTLWLKQRVDAHDHDVADLREEIAQGKVRSSEQARAIEERVGSAESLVRAATTGRPNLTTGYLALVVVGIVLVTIGTLMPSTVSLTCLH
jgi:hypothetical protein